MIGDAIAKEKQFKFFMISQLVFAFLLIVGFGFFSFNISKIRKLITSRDFEKIDLGIQLLISLNNISLFEAFLNGVKFDKEAYDWEKLKRNKMNKNFEGKKIVN